MDLIQAYGMARLHLMEAANHIENAIDLTRDCSCEAEDNNDEYAVDLLDDVIGDLKNARHCISTSHMNLLDELLGDYDYDDWSGLEAFLHRAGPIMSNWSSYEFSEWKSTGKVPNHGQTQTTDD